MANKYYSDEILASYDLSFAELEKIEKSLEDPDISVDMMSELAERCLPLIRTCKAKLLETQNNVEEILKEVENIK
ncbi:MAG: exodeoxyribonuclease VII small subunit [Bacteroidales bacterium]|nr:exodeoxyribonuclease VII small subunit [Bacteroidales bacterium]